MREKNFRVDHAPVPDQNYLTQMLTRDLFAVANLINTCILYCVRLSEKKLEEHLIPGIFPTTLRQHGGLGCAI